MGNLDFLIVWWLGTEHRSQETGNDKYYCLININIISINKNFDTICKALCDIERYRDE